MARQNYKAEKRRRELEKKRKKENAINWIKSDFIYNFFDIDIIIIDQLYSMAVFCQSFSTALNRLFIPVNAQQLALGRSFFQYCLRMSSAAKCSINKILILLRL